MKEMGNNSLNSSLGMKRPEKWQVPNESAFESNIVALEPDHKLSNLCEPHMHFAGFLCQRKIQHNSSAIETGMGKETESFVNHA